MLFACLSGIVHAGPDITTHVFGAKKQAFSSYTDTIAAGYYSATTLHGEDGDLTAGNIKTGVTIFGITGTLTVINHELPDTAQTTSRYAYDDATHVGVQPSYTDNNNGTITDNNTRLMWVRSGYATAYTGSPACSPWDSWCLFKWLDALSYCEGLIYATYDNWRLPNVRELESIVDYSVDTNGKTDPTINSAFLNTKNSVYWTSTTMQTTTNAWIIGFDGGGTSAGTKTGNNGLVRCVRDP